MTGIRRPGLNSTRLIALAVVLFSTATPAVLADSPLLSGIQAADMNKAVRAQNDLFEYANG